MNHGAIEVPALQGAGLMALALLLTGIAGATIGRSGRRSARNMV